MISFNNFYFQLNAEPQNIPDMYSKPGTACNDYTGYCDVFQKCREVRIGGGHLGLDHVEGTAIGKP